MYKLMIKIILLIKYKMRYVHGFEVFFFYIKLIEVIVKFTTTFVRY